jgi:hypothetical protein
MREMKRAEKSQTRYEFPAAPRGVERNEWESGEACTYSKRVSYPDRVCVVTEVGHLYVGFGPKECLGCGRTADFLVGLNAEPCSAPATTADVQRLMEAAR